MTDNDYTPKQRLKQLAEELEGLVPITNKQMTASAQLAAAVLLSEKMESLTEALVEMTEALDLLDLMPPQKPRKVEKALVMGRAAHADGEEYEEPEPPQIVLGTDNPVSLLNYACQLHGLSFSFDIQRGSGADHIPRFTGTLGIQGRGHVGGEGRTWPNKQEAKKGLARLALVKFFEAKTQEALEDEAKEIASQVEVETCGG